MKSSLILFFCVVLITACTPDSGDTPRIAEDQRQALEKAQAVEGQVQQATEASRRNIEAQTE